MLKYQKLSIPSKQYNEDGLIIQHPLYVVFDGATPLYANESSASQMVRYLEEHLYDRFNNLRSMQEALNQLSIAYYKLFQSDHEKARIPSSGLAAVIDDGDYFSLYVLGDCEIVYLNHQEKAKRFAYYDLQKLDKQAIKEMKEIAKKKKIDLKEARFHIDDLLINNRRLMNEKNGYNVFAPSNNPSFNVKSKRIRKSTTKTIFLYTDGFGQAFENLKIANGYSNLFESTLDIEKIKEEILKRWNQDQSFNSYPRFKERDDLTIIKIINA